MFNWFRVLWSLNDEKLIEINGIEYTTYLVYLRHIAVFFFTLTVFNVTFMVPTYLTGSPPLDPQTNATMPLNTTMDTITELNIEGLKGKVAFTYFM
jgi:hypothetical protein